MVTTPQQQW